MGLGPVELARESSLKQNSKKEKSTLFFLILYLRNRITEISVKKSDWRLVEWVGDHLTGWGLSQKKTSSQAPRCAS